MVAVHMSGGLDSTAVAAMATGLMSTGAAACHPHAYTVVYDRLVPDDERYYAGLAAEALGIPIHYLAADDYDLYEPWDEPPPHTPEPDNSPLAVIDVDQFVQIGAQSRVVLTGYGGDPALRTSRLPELARGLGLLPVLSYVGAEALRWAPSWARDHSRRGETLAGRGRGLRRTAVPGLDRTGAGSPP